jgi:hypothetical protein
VSLISEITSIAQAIAPTATVILTSKFNADYTAYSTPEAALPLIVIDNQITKNSEIKKNNNVIKDTKISIQILNLDSQDNTDSQSQTISDNCEDIADQIAVKIYQLLEVRPSGNQRYTVKPLYRVFGSMMTGVVLDMQVNYNSIVAF